MDGSFKNEIIEIEIKDKRNKKNVKKINQDEGCMKFNESKIRQLRTVFKKGDNATVTAGIHM